MFICIYDISNSVDNAGAAEPEGARFLDLIASIAWLFLGGNSMACNGAESLRQRRPVAALAQLTHAKNNDR